MRKNQTGSDVIVITRRQVVIGVILLIAVVVLVGVWSSIGRQSITITGEPVQIPHIHGLGFSSDGNQLIIPAHIGLLVYEASRWSQPDLPAHDYMGYSPIDSGFFSSGHPDLRTDYEPFLGLIKSEDGGRTITTLVFEGESDFHLLAAGYRNHAVYVINETPNSQLGVGMFYTLDEGERWQQSQSNGLEGSPIQIAVHPEEPGTVAVATERGLWLSDDFGSTFLPAFTAEAVTAVAFDLSGDNLYFGYRQLYRLDLASDESSLEPAPPLTSNNVITYIATNPTTAMLAAATNEKDVFVSLDRTSWQQIASDGVGGV